MIQTNLLAHGHADLVTHIVYDFYGERLATCSADQRIKIFRRSDGGLWEAESDWKAHDAPLIRLSFAHPLHGSLLASCSHDRTVRIWEEPSSSSAKDGRWAERAILSGAKGSVRDVAFSPPNPAYGLRVASIATDSHLRVHTSLDPDLNDWTIAHDVYVPALPPPGTAEDGGDAHAAGAGGSSMELATGGWGLAWCKEKWWGSVVACFAGTSGVVKIISLDPTPSSLLHLTPPGPSPLTSLAWAPNCGRSYHLLATGARDGTVRIWRVEPGEPGEGEAWRGEVVADFGKGARVGMLDWNATGTTLTVSDDEGIVRIYKATYGKTWKLMGRMTAEGPADEADAD